MGFVKIIFLLFFSLFAIHAFSQTSDSLDLRLSKAGKAIERAEILADVASKEAGKNVDQSNLYAQRALKELGTINSTVEARIACGVYRTLGLNYYYNGNNDSSIISCEKALLLAKKLKNTKEIADSYLAMQTAYREMGRSDKAIEVSSLALKYYEIEKDLKGKARATLNIGILYDDQKQPVKALEYLGKARDLFFELKDTAQLANAITRAANVYKDSRSHDTAKVMYLEALALFESIGHKRGIAVIYNNLAGLSNIFNSKQALDYYEKALKARTELGDKVSVCMIYNNMGAVYMNDKQYARAVELLKKGLVIATEIDTKQNLLTIYHALAGCYKRLNKPDEAFEMISKYSELKDSLFSKESIEKIEEIQTKYETEKKEQEIKLLNNANELKELEINKNKAEITKQNQQKLIIVLILVFFIGISVVIFRSYRTAKRAKEIITVQKREIEKQKNEVDEKQKEIVDSINYAKRIQYALLANNEILATNLKDHFVLFKPKDIVSGDFYWATKHNDKFYLAVCDSTGHGVPGAFMSLLNIGFLNEAIKEKQIEEPDKIFNYVRERLIESIGKGDQRDGMDGILICINLTNNEATYSAANNNPVLVTAGTFTELPKDKMPVGKGERVADFSLFRVNGLSGDTLYLYTDGFADQFGGPKGKKFKYRQLNDLLLSNSNLSMMEQRDVLLKNFVNWRGPLEQVDDVCVIGIKL